jgi:hypothetical protein
MPAALSSLQEMMESATCSISIFLAGGSFLALRSRADAARRSLRNVPRARGPAKWWDDYCEVAP